MDMDLLVGIVYMYSAAAAVCDFTIGPLPAFMIGRLKMDRLTKMAVIGVLSIGCVYVPAPDRTGWTLTFRQC